MDAPIGDKVKEDEVKKNEAKVGEMQVLVSLNLYHRPNVRTGGSCCSHIRPGEYKGTGEDMSPYMVAKSAVADKYKECPRCFGRAGVLC